MVGRIERQIVEELMANERKEWNYVEIRQRLKGLDTREDMTGWRERGKGG